MHACELRALLPVAQDFKQGLDETVLLELVVAPGKLSHGCQAIGTLKALDKLLAVRIFVLVIEVRRADIEHAERFRLSQEREERGLTLLCVDVVIVQLQGCKSGVLS